MYKIWLMATGAKNVAPPLYPPPGALWRHMTSLSEKSDWQRQVSTLSPLLLAPCKWRHMTSSGRQEEGSTGRQEEGIYYSCAWNYQQIIVKRFKSGFWDPVPQNQLSLNVLGIQTPRIQLSTNTRHNKQILTTCAWIYLCVIMGIWYTKLIEDQKTFHLIPKTWSYSINRFCILISGLCGGG